jgi:uncharacterized membrane protein YraQ (UPF0718 family)
MGNSTGPPYINHFDRRHEINSLDKWVDTQHHGEKLDMTGAPALPVGSPPIQRKEAEPTMMTHLTEIARFIANGFLEIWPYLLITIPLAVAIQMSEASKHIRAAFRAGPRKAIFLSTAVGAFSPFCGCTVIPIVASLLIAGVPLGPVMAFWVASPSMGPEIFFLSVPVLGWNLAVGRLIGTFLLSLAAGFISHALMERGWLGENILRQKIRGAGTPFFLTPVQKGWEGLKKMAFHWKAVFSSSLEPVAGASGAAAGCCDSRAPGESRETVTISAKPEKGGDVLEPAGSFRRKLWTETRNAAGMVIQFMALAFLIEALIVLYVPESWIARIVGNQNPLAIFTAALIGVPAYTTELTALPMVGGLLEQGMDPGAAMAFLVAGPTTTLPAMAAVWGLATRRVFVLYVSFALVGSILLGYGYKLVLHFI